MATLREALGRAVKFGFCTIQNTPAAGALIIAGFLNRAAGLTEIARQQANAASALNCFGDPIPDPPPPPFTGGQCPAPARYSVTYRRTPLGPSGNPGTPVTDTVTAGGNGYLGPIVRVEGRGSPAFQQAVLIHGNGLETPIRSGSCAAGCFTDLSIVSVARINPTVPDNCGDQPTEYPPPAPIDIDVDVTFDDVLGVEVTVPVNIEYSPTTINFDGTVRAPFTVNISPEVNITGNINLDTGNVTFNFGGNNPPGRTDDDPSTDLPEEDEPDPPEPEPPPPGFGIAGVFVYSNRVSRTRETIIPFPIAGSILAPRVASVKFEILGGDLGAWTPDIDVKGVSTFIPCPVEWGAARVNVRWEPGWGGQFIPLYRDLPSV